MTLTKAFLGGTPRSYLVEFRCFNNFHLINMWYGCVCLIEWCCFALIVIVNHGEMHLEYFHNWLLRWWRLLMCFVRLYSKIQGLEGLKAQREAWKWDWKVKKSSNSSLGGHSSGLTCARPNRICRHWYARGITIRPEFLPFSSGRKSSTIRTKTIPVLTESAVACSKKN